jgi:tRNA 2-thiouridine synthesizing protein A
VSSDSAPDADQAAWAELPGEEDARERALVELLQRHANAHCRSCDANVCGHGVLFSVICGYGESLRCLDCLASTMELERSRLLERAWNFLWRRSCYRAAWQRCDRLEGEDAPCGLQRTAPEPDLAGSAAAPLPEQASMVPAAQEDSTDLEWDAGTLACGDLLLELRSRLAGMAPGSIVRVVARDAAAPADIPAWCRLTGHALLAADHPAYRIRKR